MDLNGIAEIARLSGRDDLRPYVEGDAWLAGGTWLFSEPQPRLKRLIDLSTCDWAPLIADEAGLFVSATCTVATLDAFEPPAGWIGARLIGPCCRAFLASFKIWNMATFGGNICASLPAGPMISLAAALDGVCVVWAPDHGERRLSIFDFITGAGENAFRPGELLRGVEMPLAALSRRGAFRRASLSPLGRSGVLLTGTLGASGDLAIVVSAATRRPIRIAFPDIPSAEELADQVDAEIPNALYHDDIHGLPDWRRHMTFEFAEDIRVELGGAAA